MFLAVKEPGDSEKKDENLELHLSNARQIAWNPDDRWVIYSDLHMGNGGRYDDFARNSEMFNSTLEDFYLPGGYKLILNGDVEELQKFTWRQIFSQWKTTTYRLFDQFAEEDRLFKTVGNHDSRLILDLRESHPYRMDTVLEMTGLDFPVLFYHGHQVSEFYMKYSDISRIGVRYFAMPLGIMNRSVAHHSRRRHHLERKIYEYSRQESLISVIGHTHRPLFESLSKAEALRFRIEYLLTRYREASASQKAKIEEEINDLKTELVDWRRRKRRRELQSGLYAEDDVPLPCVFNSGTVVGKRGMTCLEFFKGRVRLVHWYGHDDAAKFGPGSEKHSLRGGSVRRRQLRQAKLSYIMDSLRLLS